MEESRSTKKQRVNAQQAAKQPLRTEAPTSDTIERAQGRAMEKGKTSSMSPNEVLGFPEIPTTTHEFAALLQFGT